MNSSKIGHSYEAFTYLFGQNIFIQGLECFIHLLSANNNFPIDLLKLAITGNFGLIFDSWTQTIHFFPKLAGYFIVESRINPWLLVTAILKDLPEELLFAESRRIKIFRPNKQVCICYRSGKSWWNSWRCAAQLFLALTDHQSWGIFFNGEVPSNNTVQNQPKNSCKPEGWFHSLPLTTGGWDKESRLQSILSNLLRPSSLLWLISGKFCSLPAWYPPKLINYM